MQAPGPEILRKSETTLLCPQCRSGLVWSGRATPTATFRHWHWIFEFWLPSFFLPLTSFPYVMSQKPSPYQCLPPEKGVIVGYRDWNINSDHCKRLPIGSFYKICNPIVENEGFVLLHGLLIVIWEQIVFGMVKIYLGQKGIFLMSRFA